MDIIKRYTYFDIGDIPIFQLLKLNILLPAEIGCSGCV